MLNKRPQYRKRISKSQIKSLELLFKFRFMNVPLLSEYTKKDKSTIYERLFVLTEQGYVRKAYDSSYRLPPKPAIYSLAPKGITYLKHSNAEGRYSENALRNMYKNGSASTALVERSIDVFTLCLQLESQYPGVFYIFTKSEMNRFSDLLRPLSDVYLRRTDPDTRGETDDEGSQEYALEILEPGIMTWILRRRLHAHQELVERLDNELDQSYPTLLFVCGNESTERRIHALAENSYFDYAIWTTTSRRLASGELAVWRQGECDEDEAVLRGL
jgi:DNA-binding transcriptional ArsR family regulator